MLASTYANKVAASLSRRSLGVDGSGPGLPVRAYHFALCFLLTVRSAQRRIRRGEHPTSELVASTFERPELSIAPRLSLNSAC